MGEAPVARKADDVVGAMSLGYLGCLIRAAIIHHQPLDYIDAWKGAGKSLQGQSQCLLFVEAGDLDNKFSLALRCLHASSPWVWSGMVKEAIRGFSAKK
jgi:hypothetical protein